MKEFTKTQKLFHRFFITPIPQGCTFPELPLQLSTEEIYGPQKTLATFPLLGEKAIVLSWNVVGQHLTIAMQSSELALEEGELALIPTLYDQIFLYELLHFKKDLLTHHILKTFSLPCNVEKNTPLFSLKDLSFPIVPTWLQQDFHYWLTQYQKNPPK